MIAGGSWRTWVVVAAVAVSVVPAIEVHKLLWNRRYGHGNAHPPSSSR